MKMQHILVPIDLAHAHDTAALVEMAEGLGRGHHVVVHLLYVDQSFIHRAGSPQLGTQNYSEHRSQAETSMQALVAAMPESLQGRYHYREGIAHDQILETAQQLGVDAIVMMARKPGLRSYFIGSTAERVVRHAHCSVFIVRASQDD